SGGPARGECHVRARRHTSVALTRRQRRELLGTHDSQRVPAPPRGRERTFVKEYNDAPCPSPRPVLGAPSGPKAVRKDRTSRRALSPRAPQRSRLSAGPTRLAGARAVTPVQPTPRTSAGEDAKARTEHTDRFGTRVGPRQSTAAPPDRLNRRIVHDRRHPQLL